MVTNKNSPLDYCNETPYFLIKIKLTDTNLCTFCSTDVETITHLFYECRYTKTLISRITGIINNFDRNVLKRIKYP